jgi:hypothetical protein
MHHSMLLEVMMYLNLYALPLFAVTVIMLLMAYRAWRFRFAPAAKAFILLVVCNVVYALFYALEISSLSLDW